jgi:hypothetical protein
MAEAMISTRKRIEVPKSVLKIEIPNFNFDEEIITGNSTRYTSKDSGIDIDEVQKIYPAEPNLGKHFFFIFSANF